MGVKIWNPTEILSKHFLSPNPMKIKILMVRNEYYHRILAKFCFTNKLRKDIWRKNRVNEGSKMAIWGRNPENWPNWNSLILATLEAPWGSGLGGKSIFWRQKTTASILKPISIKSEHLRRNGICLWSGHKLILGSSWKYCISHQVYFCASAASMIFEKASVSRCVWSTRHIRVDFPRSRDHCDHFETDFNKIRAFATKWYFPAQGAYFDTRAHMKINISLVSRANWVYLTQAEAHKRPPPL